MIEYALGASPIAARTTMQLTAAGMRDAAEAKREALVVCENECASKPIVVGLLAPPPGALAEQIATVDGQRVVIEGQDEVVLRCGEASITLRRNGRLVIRGAYVETRAKGANRIRGSERSDQLIDRSEWLVDRRSKSYEISDPDLATCAACPRLS